MTTQKLFKRRVRERMTKTGESYTAARHHLAAKAAPRTPDWDLASAAELASDERLTEATGRGWEAWIGLLQRWGARDRKHGEIVEHLIAEHGVPGWWAQSITIGFERASGMRRKHQQAGGFTVYASKTVAVPVEALFEAFVDDERRGQWLADGSMAIRSSQPEKTARFDWDDGSTRFLVTFESKGAAKSTAYVAHERLPDPGAAEAAKVAWRQRLTTLKTFLESSPPRSASG
jgi:hypothetical protein